MSQSSTSYQQRPVATIAVDAPRRHVMDLQHLTCELEERVAAANDFLLRDSSATDASLAVEIALLSHFAEKYVFVDPGAFEDERAITELSNVLERARRAMTYLKSPAPALQRRLVRPSASELAFIQERMLMRRRSAGCRIEREERGVLQYLRIPDTPLTLSNALRACANLNQAARVLRAIGLTPELTTSQILCCDETIIRG